MRKTIILAAAGLSVALAGAALASDHGGERRDSERGANSPPRDERSENGAREGKRRQSDAHPKQEGNAPDHDDDRNHDRRKARSDRRS